MNEGENVRMQYIEKENGDIVDGPRAGEIRKGARAIWVHLRDKNAAKPVWGEMSSIAKDYYHAEMKKRFPELCFCDGNWKAERISTDNYSSWYRKLKTAGIKEETDIDLDNSILPSSTKRTHTDIEMTIAKKPRTQAKLASRLPPLVSIPASLTPPSVSPTASLPTPAPTPIIINNVLPPIASNAVSPEPPATNTYTTILDSSTITTLCVEDSPGALTSHSDSESPPLVPRASVLDPFMLTQDDNIPPPKSPLGVASTSDDNLDVLETEPGGSKVRANIHMNLMQLLTVPSAESFHVGPTVSPVFTIASLNANWLQQVWIVWR